MDEDKASKIITVLFYSAGLLCLLGIALELLGIGTFAFPKCAGVAVVILIVCYIIGKKSFPEWNKLEGS